MERRQRERNSFAEERKELGPPPKIHEASRLNEKIALRITSTLGSMKVFWSMLAVMILWMGGLGDLLFNDPYPFELMLLVFAGVFQALAMVAVMVGQNILAKAEDEKTDMMYRDTEAILQEVRELHEHLHHQDEYMRGIANKKDV